MYTILLLNGMTDFLIETLDIFKQDAFELASRMNLSSPTTSDLEPLLNITEYQILLNKVKNYPLKTSAFILGLGFSLNILESILKYFGKSDRLVEAITENPYILLEIEEITFQRIDKIALETFKIPEDSHLRHRAFVSNHLTTLCFKQGHLFIYIEKFFETKINVDKSKVKIYLKELIQEKKIIFENNKLYPALNYKAEVESARMLAELIKQKNTSTFFSGLNVEKYIKDYENSQTQNILNGSWKKLKWSDNIFEFSEEQKIAIRKFFTERFFVITGLPGSGKTTVTKALVDLCRSKNLKISLMAPTGVAAKRLSDLCDFEASTIHKTLCFDGSYWHKNKDNKLDSDVYIVDESSMIDQILLYRLLRALPDKEFILVFIGDAAQIPAVSPGDVLHNLIVIPNISHVKLTKIFRQKEASEIIINAHKINAGDINLSTEKKDFFFINIEQHTEILKALIKIVDKFKDENFQILSPKYEGILGVNNLNSIFQNILNPLQRQKVFKTKFSEFRVGDPLMILKNDYMQDVFNGEKSTLINITKSKKLIISVNGREISYSQKEAGNRLTLDYSRTFHKSQGAEFDYVIIPYVREFSIQLQRNLLYTGVTRAKQKVFIVGHLDALNKAIKNKFIQKRNTSFPQRLNYFLATP